VGSSHSKAWIPTAQSKSARKNCPKEKAGDQIPADHFTLLVMLVLLVLFMLVPPLPVGTLPFALQTVEVDVGLMPLL